MEKFKVIYTKDMKNFVDKMNARQSPMEYVMDCYGFVYGDGKLLAVILKPLEIMGAEFAAVDATEVIPLEGGRLARAEALEEERRERERRSMERWTANSKNVR